MEWLMGFWRWLGEKWNRFFGKGSYMAFKQVSFLPWIRFNSITKLGPVTFWPYYEEADQKVIDPEVNAYLNKYFVSYVDREGNPVDTITICSYGKINFHKLNDKEWQQLRNAVDVLIICFYRTSNRKSSMFR
jgi:cellobiose-specific phosphotransferase system component IIB